MFAAVGGLAFSIAAVLKLQGYMGYLLPMPIVLSAIRSGPTVARKTTVATAFLLFGALPDSGCPTQNILLVNDSNTRDLAVGKTSITMTDLLVNGGTF